jgi:hypothetical protein
MRKSEAIELLGGTIPAAAEAIGVTYQAVDKWPEELPPRITDRVQAALWRKSQGIAAPRSDANVASAQG